MSRRIEGVTEKILACAKEEFLEKGYEDASLRTIASKANSSKGAIYIRYEDKAALFQALVAKTLEEFIALSNRLHKGFDEMPKEEQKDNLKKGPDAGYPILIDYVYENFDVFKLVCNCSEKPIYKDFIHELVKIEVDTTIKFGKTFNCDEKTMKILHSDFPHVVYQAFHVGFFEIVVHDMSKEDATEHITRLREFYTSGWGTILKPFQTHGEA